MLRRSPGRRQGVQFIVQQMYVIRCKEILVNTRRDKYSVYNMYIVYVMCITVYALCIYVYYVYMYCDSNFNYCACNRDHVSYNAF